MVKQVTQIPIPEKPPAYERISWWFENTFVRSAKRIINSISGQLREILNFSLMDFAKDYERDLIVIAEPFFNEILASPDIPDFVKAPVRKSLQGTSPAGLAVLAIIVPILAMALGEGLRGPIGRIVEGVFDQILRSRLLDPGTLVVLWRRGIISEGRLNPLLWKNGLSNEAIVALKGLSIALPDDTTLTQALWRKQIDESYVRDILDKRGYDANYIGMWIEARRIIPSPQDLVSMSVREAFNDSVAARFGYDEDFPTEAAEWAEKQGLGQQWFVRYWRAHWTLPGLLQVREMYHRGIVKEGDVLLYLKAADLPAFWRENLVKWMYSEITRVDVRRLYDLGIIDYPDVYQRYLKLGYTSDDSTLMTQWTIATYQEKDRELTKSDILGMYKEGILNDDETRNYLSALDYRQADIELLMVRVELNRAAEYEKQIISNVKKLFMLGEYTRTDVFSALGKIDTPATFIHQSLQVWDLEKLAKVRIPTITQLRDMVKGNVISIGEFRLQLGHKGYDSQYIDWYVALWLEE